MKDDVLGSAVMGVMIAENVVITTDHEGNNHYVPVDKLKEFNEWCDSEPDDEFEYSTPFATLIPITVCG